MYGPRDVRMRRPVDTCSAHAICRVWHGSDGTTLRSDGVVHAVRGHVRDDRHGSQPVGGVTIYVDVTTPGSWYFFGTVKSDAAGRYSVTGLPEGLIHLWVYESGYAQTCITSVRVTGNAAADVELVPITTLVASTLPPLQTRAGPNLTGVVFERTQSGGVRHVPGVRLGLEIGDGRHVTTVSDSTGRYEFCRVPEHVEVFAVKEGYRQSIERPVPGSHDRVMDIELTPR